MFQFRINVEFFSSVSEFMDF